MVLDTFGRSVKLGLCYKSGPDQVVWWEMNVAAYNFENLVKSPQCQEVIRDISRFRGFEEFVSKFCTLLDGRRCLASNEHGFP